MKGSPVPAWPRERAAPGEPRLHDRHSAKLAELMCSYDLRGNIIEVNEAFEHATGYTRQEARGLNVSALLDASSLEAARVDILQQVGGANAGPHAIVVRCKEGLLLAMEMTTRLVFEKGRPVAVQGFGRKIRPADLDALRAAEAKLSTRNEELAQFTGHLKHLHRLGTTHYDSLDRVLADYLETGCLLFHLACGFVFEAEGEHAVVRACRGSAHPLGPGSRIPLEQTHWASVAGRLRTQVHSGIPETRAIHPELQNCLATPILVGSELYGTLCFAGAGGLDPLAFTAADREIVELMARSIGRSILEDRLHSERKTGESLEGHRNRVLEMVAGNQPLSRTLGQLALMLEAQCPGALCSVCLVEDGRFVCDAAPSLPASYAAAVNAMSIGAIPGRAAFDSFSALPLFGACGPGHPLSASRFALASQMGLVACSAFPILSGSGQLLGAIVLHFRAGVPSTVGGDLLRMASRLAAIAIEQRRLTDRLAYQAQHDSLTGLPNRSHLLELLATRLASAAQEGELTAVLFIDLDRFKQINDTLGHLVGDRILVEVAQRLRSGLRGQDDIAGRMGGDEFTVILSSPRTQQSAFEAARQILHSLRAPYMVGGQELFVTASIGMSFYPEDGTDIDTLLRNSDMAMYRAKNSGKNDLEFFVQDAHTSGMERLEMENALRRAVEKSELELYYQPIVSMGGELDGLEVLLVWNHPRRGRISPKEFIPIAEESGLIVSIGSWVLREACAQGARWLQAGLRPVRMAVNVSAIQFARPDFVESVAAALDATGFPALRFELELTESFVVRDVEESAQRLARLRELGVRIAIDDFGTGYSSLSYLRHLPVDTLKIDQSFLRDLQAPTGSLPVVQTIVSLAHNMNLSVVAEGVETPADLELLRAAGCDKVQGHLYGESLREAEARVLLAGRDPVVPVA